MGLVMRNGTSRGLQQRGAGRAADFVRDLGPGGRLHLQGAARETHRSLAWGPGGVGSVGMFFA